MKKFIIACLGIFSVGGTLLFLGSIIATFLESIFSHKLIFNDSIVIALWLFLPTLFSIYLLRKIIKEPDYYKKYKISFNIFSYGFITSIVLFILSLLYELLIVREIAFVGLFSLFVVMIALILSFVASIISWLIIFFKNK